MIVNVLIALDQVAHQDVRTAVLADDETYTGPVSLRQRKLFRMMRDYNTTRRLFRTDTAEGKTWTVWTIIFDEKVNVLQKIQDELDDLANNYPSRFIVTGAWHWDGRHVGTQWELDQDGNRTGDTTGTPTYPPHARILKACPLEWNPVTELFDIEPTDLSGANVLAGQAVRRLT